MEKQLKTSCQELCLHISALRSPNWKYKTIQRPLNCVMLILEENRLRPTLLELHLPAQSYLESLRTFVLQFFHYKIPIKKKQKECN